MRRNKGTGVVFQSCLPASANEVDIVASPSTKRKEKEVKNIRENGHSDEVA